MKIASLPAASIRCSFLLLTFFFLGSIAGSAEDCKTVLKPLFDWADMDSQHLSSPVNLTVSVFRPHVGANLSDVVEYSFLSLLRNYSDTAATGIAGTSVTFNGSLEGTGSVFTNISKPSFTPAQITFQVKVTPEGVVSLQKFLAGKAFLGRPAAVFVGVCELGVITGNQGGDLYTLSLSKGPQRPKIH